MNSLKLKQIPVIDLSESNPTRCQFKYLNQAAILRPFSNPANLNYNPSPKGKKEARQAIQFYYRKKGIHVDLDRILLTASTSEAYTYIFRLLANSKERILVPKPSYPLFQFIVDLNDVTLDSYPLDHQENRWEINFKYLTDHIFDDTKAMIVVHPNNPTGSFIKKVESDKLIQIAKLKSLALISDEVFSDYAFENDSERITSFAGVSDILTFSLGGISKSLGLPQMKLSWVVVNGPEKLVKEAMNRLEIISDTFLSVNTPSQEALPIWFDMINEIQSEIKERIKTNLDWIIQITSNENRVKCFQPEGGWYVILKLLDQKNEEEWALEFLQKDRVFVHPGYFFDMEEELCFVISLLLPPDQFQEGCQRIFDRVKKIQNS